MPRVEFGIGMGRNLAIAEVARHVQAAEDLAYERVSFIDTQSLSRDVYVMMSIAAMHSRRLKIGQGMTNPYTRHPSVTANATGTIHELSGGRAFLGLGAGFSSTGTLGKQPRAVDQLRKTTLAIKALSRGEEAEWEGQRIRSEWMRQPYPVILGSDGARSMRMAGEIADGIDFPGADPALVSWRLEHVREGAARAGRDHDKDGFEVWLRTGCFVASSKEEARAQLRSYVATYAHQFYLSHLRWDNDATRAVTKLLDDELLEDVRRVAASFEMYEHEKIGGRNEQLVSDRLVDFFMICGTADQCIERIEQLAELGIRRVIWSVYPLRDKIGMMERFSREVMPAFRS